MPADRAFVLGLESSRMSGGLLSHLFSVRSRGLFGELAGDEAADYLSGLLIGHELDGLLDAPAGAEAPPVHLIGQPALVRRYLQALAWRGVPARVHADVLVTRGLRALALRAARQGRIDPAGIA
jgi:2-dehydro-3-deoxygalactonokinase